MKLTKHTVLALITFIAVALVGAKLSLKTMEQQPKQNKKALEMLSMPKPSPYFAIFRQAGFSFLPSFWIDERLKKNNQKLLADFQSEAALNEFLNHGTFESRNLREVVSDGWAIEYLKPIMQSIIFPRCDNILLKHTDLVNSVAFSPDGKTIASSSHDYTLRLWSKKENGSWYESQKFQDPKNKTYAKLAFSPNGNYLASSASDRTVRIWSLQNKSWKEFQTLENPEDLTYCMVFSPDSKYLASSACIWMLQEQDDEKSWKEFKELEGHKNVIISIAFSPNGQYIASTSYDQSIRIWALNKQISKSIAFAMNEIIQRYIAFNPNGILTSVSITGQEVNTWLFEPSDNSFKKLSHQKLPINNLKTGLVSLSPQGDSISFTSLENNTIQIWSFKNKVLTQSFELAGHTDHVKSVAFSPIPYEFASGSFDNTVQVWSDLVGDNNVAEKIMLLQLLTRDGGKVLTDKPHLQVTFATFSEEAQKYLKKKYNLKDWIPTDFTVLYSQRH